MAEARVHLIEAVQLAVSSRDMPVVSRAVLTVAKFALAARDAGRAAELLGASAQLRGYDGLADPEVVRVSEPVRAELERTEFSSNFEKGRALSREAALDLARATLEDDAGPGPGPSPSSI